MALVLRIGLALHYSDLECGAYRATHIIKASRNRSLQLIGTIISCALRGTRATLCMLVLIHLYLNSARSLKVAKNIHFFSRRLCIVR